MFVLFLFICFYEHISINFSRLKTEVIYLHSQIQRFTVFKTLIYKYFKNWTLKNRKRKGLFSSREVLKLSLYKMFEDTDNSGDVEQTLTETLTRKTTES